MDFKAVESFITVASSRSLTEAARALKVPLATVSRRLHELEAELGVTLVERTTRRMALTDTGRAFLEQVREPIAALRSAEARVLERAPDSPKLLRIAVAPTLADLVLPAIVARYLKEHPRVTTEVLIGAEFMNLRASAIDLAIRVAPAGEPALPDDQNLVVRRLFRSIVRLVASPKYLQRRGMPKTTKDLAEHDLVSLLSSASSWQFEVDEVLAVTPRALVGSASCARQLCLLGVGIAALPEFLVEPDIKAGRLLEIDALRRPNAKQVFVAFPKERGSLVTVRAFLNLLYATFKPLKSLA